MCEVEENIDVEQNLLDSAGRSATPFNGFRTPALFLLGDVINEVRVRLPVIVCILLGDDDIVAGCWLPHLCLEANNLLFVIWRGIL